MRNIAADTCVLAVPLHDFNAGCGLVFFSYQNNFSAKAVPLHDFNAGNSTSINILFIRLIFAKQ